MLNSANSTPRQRKSAPQPTAHAGDPVSSGHGFSRAVQTRPQEPSPFVHPDAGRARLSNSRSLRRASANYSHSALSFERRTGIMSTSSAKLDFPPTPAKSTTSNFLIDNFCTLLRCPASKSTSLGNSSALHPERTRTVSSAAAFPGVPFPAFPRAADGLSSGSAAELERGIEAPPGSGHLAASSAGKLFMTGGHPIFDRLEAAEVYNCVSSPRGRYETSV